MNDKDINKLAKKKKCGDVDSDDDSDVSDDSDDDVSDEEDQSLFTIILAFFNSNNIFRNFGYRLCVDVIMIKINCSLMMCISFYISAKVILGSP